MLSGVFANETKWNPVRAGVVYKAFDYIYSSASNYLDGKGLLSIKILDNPIVDVLLPSSFTKYNSFKFLKVGIFCGAGNTI